MERDELRLRLRTVMAEAFETPVDTLPAAADTDTVEKWDSLGQLTLIECVEAAFGVAFSHEETLAMLSEEELLDGLALHLGSEPALATAG